MGRFRVGNSTTYWWQKGTRFNVQVHLEKKLWKLVHTVSQNWERFNTIGLASEIAAIVTEGPLYAAGSFIIETTR